MASAEKLGLIAGNGKFPFLVLDAARAQGFDVVVAAIKEETSAEIESRGAASVHWLSLGELSKLIDTFKAAGVTRAVMAGQVKHKQIFSAIKPDWRLAKLLLALGTRNTDSLLGAVAKVLADEGIVLENSTALLEALNRGHVARAGLDVFALEPLRPDHPLARHDSVTLSAHSGFRTYEASATLLGRALDIVRKLATRSPNS